MGYDALGTGTVDDKTRGQTLQQVSQNMSDDPRQVDALRNKVNAQVAQQQAMRDGSGMSFNQFKDRFGMSSTNPFGQTSFTNFMNKFGAKPNYTQQLSNLPRQGTTFRGNTLRTDAKGKLGSVSRNPITGEETVLPGVDAATYNAPGAVADRIMQQQYDAYRNPFNLKGLDSYDPRYDTATPEEIDAGKITRGGRTDRGSYLGPLEEVVRPQSTGEMIARAAMPMGTGFLDTTDTYLSSAVTPEMRERGPQSLLGQVFQGATGVDPAQATSKAKSLGEGIRSLMDGRQTPAPVVQGTAFTDRPSNAPVPSFDPREMDATAQPGRSTLDDLRAALPLDYEENVGNPNYLADNNLEMEFVLDGSNLPENQQFNRDMAELAADEGEPIFRSTQNTGYDLPNTMIRNIGTPISMPEDVQAARSVKEEMRENPFATMFERMRNEGTGAQVGDILVRPDEFVPVDIEGPIGRPTRNAPNIGMPISPSAREDLDFVQFPELANAPNVGMRPATEDLDFVQFPELANAPNIGYERDLGPRTPDDLRSIGIEPTAQDLMDMQLSPTEMMQERARNMDTTYQGTRLPSDLRQADAVGATAGTSSLSAFVENNPGIGEALLGSREGQELNEIFRFGGLKPETSEIFVDTDKAEIRVQGPDFRGRNKGFTIDASEFFGKQNIPELIFDTLKEGGMSLLPDKSLAETVQELNEEFESDAARKARERSGMRNTMEDLSNISYRG